MDDTFLMGTTSSINMQSLGKIVQRAPAVGAKMWCFFLLVTLRVRYLLTVRSRGAYFEQALRCRLLPDFDAVCSVFEEGQHGRMVGECNHGDVCECTDSS